MYKKYLQATSKLAQLLLVKFITNVFQDNSIEIDYLFVKNTDM